MKQSQFIWMDDDDIQQQQEEMQPSVPMRKSKKVKKNKTEFVGWGSKQLVDFLASIGVDTANKLSQNDVTDIINKYISSNNLINPQRKKRVNCDEKLQLLFGRKTVGRIKVFDLLERHFAENQEESASDDDILPESSDEDASVTPKRKSISSAEKKTSKKTKQAPASNDSCFAEVIPENIKLVYLKKSLVEELSKDPETFDDKLTGAFVRIKSDPLDFTQKNYYQLVQVKGIKRPTGIDDVNKQLLLQVSNSFKDIDISMLSDDDFSKEECEDLQRRIKDGLLGRLIVAELQQKVQTVHQDITKHLLQTPSEQSRLLQESPKVIAEKVLPEPAKETTPEPEPNEKIILEPAEKKHSNDVSDDEDEWLMSLIKAAQDARAQDSISGGTTTAEEPAPALKPETPATEQLQPENKTDEGGEVDEGIHDAMHNLAVAVGHESRIEVPAENPKSETSVSFPSNESTTIETNLTVEVKVEAGGAVIPAESPKKDTPLSKLDSNLDSPNGNLTAPVTDVACSTELVTESPKNEAPVSKPVGKQAVAQVIELSDSDDDESTINAVHDHLERPIWKYYDPRGTAQGPFSLIALKRWADAAYFPPGFLIWKTDEPHIRLVLAEVLRQSFSGSSGRR
ncbi:hypothetical protein QQ045_002812 [Rhodiola kirilowii]